MQASKTAARNPAPSGFRVFLVCLVLILLAFFHQSLNPDKVLFANDGPLGAETANYAATPGDFFGIWQDLNSIGSNFGSRTPNVTGVVRLILQPFGFSRFYVPLLLLFLGLSAWTLFRKLGLSPLACTLGGLAVPLNTLFFSPACWGVGPQPVCYALNYLAIAALVDKSSPHYWLKTMLAGFAVGLAVTEGADIGAMLSVLVAIFTLVYTWASTEGPMLRKAWRSVARTAVVALCALFIAAQAVTSLIGTQIKGISGTGQDKDTKAQRWDFATQWSLPKREALALFIPGLFGYRMDTPMGLPEAYQKWYEGGVYWGAMGRDPAWDRYFASDRTGPPPARMLRQSGGGFYAGVLVIVVALWAVFQSFRKSDSVFPLHRRKFLWFWAGVIVVSLLLAFGRYAPFFSLVYALPYSSAVRSPAKFLTPLNWSMMILFAFGVHGLSRRYLETASARGKSWWASATAFDKRWIIGSVIALVLAVAGWGVYSSSRGELVKYLDDMQKLVQIGVPSLDIARSSIKQVGWFVFFLAASVAALTLVITGVFAGKGAKAAGILLGVILVADLFRANLPWVIYWNYKEKYATNPVIDFLREKPYEHRAAILPAMVFSGRHYLLKRLYDIEWLQHHFQYYNIQSPDIIQMPRMPQNLMAFEAATSSGELTRRYELMNTRYLLGPAEVPMAADQNQTQLRPLVDILNMQADPALRRFSVLSRFDVVPKPGVTSATSLDQFTARLNPTNGMFAVFDFAGALPRTQLYFNWQVASNDTAAVEEWVKNLQTRLPPEWGDALASVSKEDQAALKTLVSPSFNPHQTVLVSTPLPPSMPASATGADAGSVTFESYSPKHIRLKTRANMASVLLLNDKYDPNWQVRVDDQPAPLLRCNFIMRGAFIPAGSHVVEFQFKPDIRTLYISLAGMLVALTVLGYVTFSKKKETAAPAPPAHSPHKAHTEKPAA